MTLASCLEIAVDEAVHQTDGSPSAGFAKSLLPNGLRIVTEAIPGSRSVSIGIVVECGSSDEQPGEAGLAHLCEHLVFQGTSNRDARELARQIDTIGGTINAFTSRDYTCYYATVQDEYSFHALDLLGDVLMNPIFPEDELEREKRCVEREIESAMDQPSRQAHDLLLGSVWPDHALGRPVAGTIEDVRRHTRDDAIYFFHRHYVPARMIVAAAGNLIHEDFVAQVRDVFWRLMGEKLPVVTPKPVFQPGFRYVPATSHQSYVSIALQAPEFASDARFGFHVLNRILGEGMHSRLFQELRERLGLVYDVSSEYVAYREAGMLRIEFATEPEHQKAALDAVMDTVAALASWDLPVDEDELWRAKLQLRSQYLISSELVHTRMSRLASHETYLGTAYNAEAIPEAIKIVEIPELRRLAQQMLWPALANLAAVAVSPEPMSGLETPDGFQEFVNGALSRHRHAMLRVGPGCPTGTLDQPPQTLRKETPRTHAD